MAGHATAPARYDPVAIGLHWAVALLMLLMLALGNVMGDLPLRLKFDAYALHKSVGLLVLALSIFRVIWRLMNPPPPLPAGMKRHERLLAHAAHAGLYFLILALPLTGWLLVSADPKYPTIFFWLGEAPFIPMPAGIDGKATAHQFEELHELLASSAIALIVLHVGAALYHQRVRRDHLMARMLPRARRRGGDA